MSSDTNNWVLGVTLGLLGSIAINTGNNIQSLGLKHLHDQEVRPESPKSLSSKASLSSNAKPRSRKQSIPWLSPSAVKTAPSNSGSESENEFEIVAVANKSPASSMTWVVGTIVFVSGSLLNFASYAFAAQSMLASLESVQFVTNLLFGRFMLGAHVTQTMLVGTLLTVTGTVMAVQFSSKDTLELDVDDIKQLYLNPVYLSYLGIMGVLLLVLHIIYRRLDDLQNKNKPVKQSEIIMPIVYSVWSAMVGTQSTVQAKVLAELLAVQSSGHDNVFASWFLYVTIVAWAVTATIWLKRLNDALGRFNPLFIIPLLQCSFIFFAIVSGGIFFLEFDSFDANQWIGFWLGIIVMFSGLVLLTPPPSHAEDDDELHRELVNLILINGGHSLASNQSMGSHGGSLLPTPRDGIVETPDTTPITSQAFPTLQSQHEGIKQPSNVASGKSPRRPPRFSKENMTKAAMEAMREVVNESTRFLGGDPSTRAYSEAMVIATVGEDVRRRRRKALETLLCQIKDNPLSPNGYNDEIVGLIRDLELDVVVTPPPVDHEDIRTHLSLTQEKLKRTIQIELEQNATPKDDQPIRDLSNLFNIAS